jgi:esterase/lipase
MESLIAAVDTHLNQKKKIQLFRGRVLIMHTQNDDLVDVSHAERLYKWANEPKEKLIFEQGDHNTILGANEEAYFSAVELILAGGSTNIKWEAGPGISGEDNP